MTNPFLAYGEARLPSRPKKVRVVKSEADAPMKPTAAERAERDKSVQMQRYRAQRREMVDRVAKGPYRVEIGALSNFLRTMTLDDGDALIDFVKRHRSLTLADTDTRMVALRMVSDRLQRLREEDGRAPFDDSLPGEEPTVFEIIRAELGVT